MPELPEVETIKRDLNRYLRGKKIKTAEVMLVKIVQVRAFKVVWPADL